MGNLGFTPCARPSYLEVPVKRLNLIMDLAAGGTKCDPGHGLESDSLESELPWGGLEGVFIE